MCFFHFNMFFACCSNGIEAKESTLKMLKMLLFRYLKMPRKLLQLYVQSHKTRSSQGVLQWGSANALSCSLKPLIGESTKIKLVLSFPMLNHASRTFKKFGALIFAQSCWLTEKCAPFLPARKRNNSIISAQSSLETSISNSNNNK